MYFFFVLSWAWSYGSLIYNYLCNQCLSSLMLWVRFSIRARCTTLCDKVCQWLTTGRCFSPGPPVSSTNKTDRHDITEILLIVALNTGSVSYFFFLFKNFSMAMFLWKNETECMRGTILYDSIYVNYVYDNGRSPLRRVSVRVCWYIISCHIIQQGEREKYL